MFPLRDPTAISLDEQFSYVLPLMFGLSSKGSFLQNVTGGEAILFILAILYYLEEASQYISIFLP